MTVVNEMGHKGVSPFKKLAFVEFLEFIGRIANEKYKEWTNDPLYIKIEKIMDYLLPLVGMTRKEIQRRVEVIMNESDESLIEEDIDEIDDR